MSANGILRLMLCSTLQLKPSDEGLYTCDAENSRGNVQQSYRLIIQSKRHLPLVLYDWLQVMVTNVRGRYMFALYVVCVVLGKSCNNE